MKNASVTKLNQMLNDVEVDKIGVISLKDFQDTPALQQARDILPGAESVIVLAVEVFPEIIKYLISKRHIGEISLHDLFHRNNEIINGHIDWEAYKVVKKLHTMGFSGLSLPAGDAPYDRRFVEGAFSYVRAAQAAGLGVIGWHSMLITPEYGARVRLALILNDAPLESNILVAGDMPCIKCGGACIKICPVKAIAKPQKTGQFNINKYACSTYLDATLGCAECLRVCPAGRMY